MYTQGIDRFLVVSSAGLDIMDPSSQYFQPQPRISKYLRDVLKWKLRGEQLVRYVRAGGGSARTVAFTHKQVSCALC